MLTFISVLDLICILQIMASFFMLYKGQKRRMPKNLVVPFACLLSVTMLRAIGDFLEWSAISHALSDYEEYTEILVPMLWGFMFYALMQAQTEKTLRESQENLAITLDSIGEGVIVTDIERSIIRINPQAAIILGISVDQALNRPFEKYFMLVDRETLEKKSGLIEHVMEKGKVVGFAKQAVLIRHDGTERIIADSSSIIGEKPDNVFGVVTVFKDITEQTLIEEQLQHSEKMNAIGQLAGGIAHDFNNLCTGINNYSELLGNHLAEDAKSQKYITQIKNCANQAADLTRMLLAFARKGKLEEKPVDLHAVIREVITILEHTLVQSIKIECVLNAKNLHILGDYAQLENAILNISLNARDAMPEGGMLKFETRDIFLDEEFCRLHQIEVTSGNYLELLVSDTGCGMTDEVKSHIFEPFFTTKSMEKGTGLGLASVYGTIKSHHGAIEVTSTTGEGSTFVLYLPLIGNQSGEQL
ncbi:MAG: PAS domain S-box protein [Candidatus Omnitrophica bacterium]|nr:PAS domain S-box protein [Candidatus Omnitrophota bacterium]